MRILHLIDNLDVGGAQSVTDNLVRQMRAVRPRPDISLATIYRAGYFGERLSRDGFQVYNFNARYKYDIRILKKLNSLVRKKALDIVHVHLFPASYFAAACSLLHKNTRWIFTEHNVWNRRRNYRELRIIEKTVYRRFHKVTAVSDLVADALRKWLPFLEKKIVTIPNGVAIPALRDKSPEGNGNKKMNFLFVGRLSRAKGVDFLLKALAGIPEKDFSLSIVGDGPEKDLLQRLSMELGLKENVKFLGVRHDVQALMEDADVFLVPSRWEGLPMVILESMATGLPVLASSVGGIPEIVQDGVNGILFTPGDVEMLRRKLKFAIDHSDIMKSYGQEARRKVIKEYSIQKAALAYKSMYENLFYN